MKEVQGKGEERRCRLQSAKRNKTSLVQSVEDVEYEDHTKNKDHEYEDNTKNKGVEEKNKEDEYNTKNKEGE